MRINRAIPAFGIFLTVVLLGWLWVGVDAALRRVQHGDAIGASLVFGGLLMPLIFGVFLGLFYLAGYWLYIRDKSELLAYLRKAMAADSTTAS